MLEEVWQNCKARLWDGWRSGIPATRRLELGATCVSMKVDERSIVCGLEDGRVDLYSRASMERTGLVSRDKITSLDLDSRLIVTGCSEGRVRLWCRQSGQSLSLINPHSGPVTAIIIDTPVDVKGGLVTQHVFSASRDGLIRRLGLVASQEGDTRRMTLVKVRSNMINIVSLICHSLGASCRKLLSPVRKSSNCHDT